jgi:hypothetical protein
MTPLEVRLHLHRNGYAPLPLIGKVPVLKNWQQKIETNEEEIALLSSIYPAATNTGTLTRLVPTLDIDILNEEAALAIEEIVRAHHEEHGRVLARFGRWPKRAIPFRTDEPFKKIVVNLIAPNGAEEKIEFLGDGQQVAVAGLHPTTGQPYRWHGGELCQTARDELPYIREVEAHALVDEIVEMLCRDFGYRHAAERPKKKPQGNGHDRSSGAEDWAYLYNNIREGRALHDSLCVLAAKLIKSGTGGGAAVNQLRALMQASIAPHDARWQERYDDIPRLVESAEQNPKFREQPPQPTPGPAPCCSLEECHKVFRKWLGNKYDIDTIDAVIAVAAAERLPGDPVWLMIVSGSGNAKTETVQATSKVDGARIVSTISSCGALLSASPRRQQTKGATGGLLREIGDRGLLIIKDVTSILSQDRNTRSEVLGALRELHDGRWARSVGVDGGKTLEWKGRLVIIGACTTAWDAAYAVVAEMGDRFIYIRPNSDNDEMRIESGTHALDNVGQEAVMREELANAVAGVILGMKTDTACDVSMDEKKRILAISNLLTRTRTAIERDYRGNVIDSHDPEMPTRFAKQLIQMMRGALAVGMARDDALRLILRCAWDSVPKLRLQLLRDVAKNPDTHAAAIRRRMQKPRFTIDQAMEALHALGLLTCREEEKVQGTRTVWVRHYSLADRVDPSLLLA